MYYDDKMKLHFNLETKENFYIIIL